jgi:hypothetical protein
MFKTWEELTVREQLLTIISDVHKDVYGFRPRRNWDSLSDSDLKIYLDELEEQAQWELEAETERIRVNTAEFKAEVAQIIELCGCSFTDALRIKRQADGEEDTPLDEYLFDANIDPEYVKEVKSQFTAMVL